MVYTFAVLLKSQWLLQLVHYVSRIKKTVMSLFLPTCFVDSSDVYSITAKIRKLIKCEMTNFLIMTACVKSQFKCVLVKERAES